LQSFCHLPFRERENLGWQKGFTRRPGLGNLGLGNETPHASSNKFDKPDRQRCTIFNGI